MSPYLLTIARYTGIEAMRMRLMWLLAVALLVVVGLAQFAGDIAITESLQIRNAVLGSALRLFAVFMISLFVATSMVREFNDKGIDLLLALPMRRSTYYGGKLLGYSLVAVVTALLIGLVLCLFAPVGQVSIWTAALVCELILIASVSLLCLFTFTHVTIALTVVFAFYALARMIDAIQLIGHGPLIEPLSLSERFMVGVIDTLALLLPSLGRFGTSDWLVYHTAKVADLAPILAETGIFMLLLAAASLFDLYRKNL